VVLLNRFGAAIGNFEHPDKPHGGIPEAFAPYPGCFITDERTSHGESASPCDDNATATSGAQQMTLDFSVLPRSWLGLPEQRPSKSAPSRGGDSKGGRGGEEASSSSNNETNAMETMVISCDVYDILATPGLGAALGRYSGGWSAMVPPHGVKFLRLGNCTRTTTGTA
jgi:hypothetical protein